MSWLFWLFVLILLAAAGASAYMAYRTYVVGDVSVNLGGWLFRPKPEPRLGVVEQVAIDSRRRLMLVRRDDVEHLIMTGGPVDLVIEDKITTHTAERAAAVPVEPAPRVFARQLPSFGQAVNE